MKEIQMPNPKSDKKKILNLAGDLAVAGMQAAMFANYKPEDVAEFCVAVATAIMDSEIDSD